MTDLKKQLSRRGSIPFRGRRIVVTLYPGDVVGLREERRRTELKERISDIYWWAAKREAQRVVAERKAARKARSA